MGGKAIREFPGLGPKSEAMLIEEGIDSFARLKAFGAARAFAMVRQTSAKPSLNLLWGMQSAISGVPWQTIARQHRLSLLMKLEEIEKDLSHRPQRAASSTAPSPSAFSSAAISSSAKSTSAQ